MSDVRIPEIQTNRALQPTFTQYMDGDRRIMVLEVDFHLGDKKVVPLDFYFLKKVVAEILGWEATQEMQEGDVDQEELVLSFMKRTACELLHLEADREAAEDNAKTHGTAQAPKIIL